MTIERVSIGRLKARLSEYVRRARAGEVVVITDRGRPVASLSPLSGAAELEGRMAELRLAGLIRPPEAPIDLDTLLTAELPGDPTGRGVEAVLEERADSW